MSVPTSWSDAHDWMRRIAIALNEVIDGRIESNGNITLSASASTTAVKDRRVGKDSLIIFMPLTANAVNESPYVQTSDIVKNQFTVNHANNSQTDRNYRYIILGQTLN